MAAVVPVPAAGTDDAVLPKLNAPPVNGFTAAVPLENPPNAIPKSETTAVIFNHEVQFKNF